MIPYLTNVGSPSAPSNCLRSEVTTCCNLSLHPNYVAQKNTSYLKCTYITKNKEVIIERKMRIHDRVEKGKCSECILGSFC